MIRGFLFLIGLLIGLALALASQGRISHLRSLAEISHSALPVWSQNLSPQTGLWQGQMNGENAVVLEWEFQDISPDGLRFHITLADGAQTLAGPLRLPLSGPPLIAENLQGSMDTAQGLRLLQSLIPVQ